MMQLLNQLGTRTLMENKGKLAYLIGHEGAIDTINYFLDMYGNEGISNPSSG